MSDDIKERKIERELIFLTMKSKDYSMSYLVSIP